MAEEASATNGQPDALQTFGPIEGTKMPELAAPDPEKAAPQAPEPEQEASTPETDAPVEETPPTAPEDDTQPQPPPAEETPEAAATGDEQQPPARQEIPPEKLQGIIDKYNGKPESMAKALLSLRRKQTETAEERNEANSRAERLISVVEEHFDEVDGDWRLKPSVAARTLAKQPGQAQIDKVPTIPKKEDVAQEIAGRYMAKFIEQGMEQNEAKALVETLADDIETQATREVGRAKTELQAVQIEMNRRVYDVAARHLEKHPEDRELLPKMDEFFGRFPDDVKARAISEGWVDFGEQARLLRIAENLPKIVQDTWNAAQEAAGQEVTPDTGSAPQGGQNAPAKNQPDISPEERLKQGILNAAGLPGLEELFG